MLYISQSLTFESDKIYFTTSNGEDREVMMDWEDELMSASAAYVTENGGDILEVGFGMGISAGYIQSHSISSHTIVENHPDVIPKALEWAAEKPNVTVITGSWYDVLDDLATYDGVFYDTYGDEKCHEFESVLPNIVNKGGRMTCWNPVGYRETPRKLAEKRGITYEKIQLSKKPPENSYYDSDIYWMPKIQF
jgi:type IV protein arginine methyltransferase